MRPGKTITWGILPIVCCLLAALLAGCNAASGSEKSRTNETKAPASQQVYRYGDVATDIASFDPGQATDQPSLEAITMVFTGLVQFNDKLQVQPQLAQSYDISNDGLTYTFHLRPNLKFSDGQPLTASDVAYSLDRALSPAIANLNGATLMYLGQIKDAPERVTNKVSTLIGDSIKVLDSQTIQLITSVQSSYFLQALTYPSSYVVEKSVIDKWGNQWTDHLGDNGGQGGAGPFKVQSYNHTTGIVFVPNTHYYGPQPQLQRVEFDFYKTSQAAFSAYNANQVDFVKAVPPEQQPLAKLLPDNQYTQVPELTIDYIAMNYLYKPFDNVHIRQAFALAINKNIISTAIYNGVRTPTCHIIPQGMPGYNPRLQCPAGASTRGDTAKARALFQQGLQEEGLTLATFPPVKITYQSDTPALDNEITTMRQQWQQALGVTVTAQKLDFVPLLQAEAKTTCMQNDPAKCQNQGLQMWAAAWGADYPDPQDWTTLQFDQNAPNNYWNYGQNVSSSAKAQQQVQIEMEKADVEPDQQARLAHYNQIEQQLVNDVAWLPIDQRNSSAVLKPSVVGQTYNSLSLIPPNKWSSIYIGNRP
ncbi:MAG TPA: peptide ABC transporter substrate-binding protein [Ktedonobacteraceae bacterium]|nr:peptide ABC transporter substrate-binding protein [Ktedonobacteraceae bacterium]